MTYKEALTQAMRDLAVDPLVCFVGYGVRRGRVMGTLKEIPDSQIIETTLAENLMTGLAIGLSLAGRRPVVWFDRADFLTNAVDAIVNHLDKIAVLSAGDFNPAMIIRVTVGNRSKPLFTGPPHVQDFSEAFQKMVNFPVVTLTETSQIIPAYTEAYERMKQREAKPTMIFEYKDLI